jgi:hypothetical protein
VDAESKSLVAIVAAPNLDLLGCVGTHNDLCLDYWNGLILR